ncbi:ElyC/SanA/YdcF family protein [Pseudoalteromonas denitrificans]|uniref:Uncharacterized SAM-binding protein YcdF, DUF218 family n=1 Tax=Pseudoalteromonas denitrificans DSM 6059 TaxID=1123010 RepID=A0A1I1KX97_9GAMM|nr:ElyC/SanA/YdcF family protein [Pseudoalteromonas denitrificans]SFC65437.1 Uncharacterized SAM-binding protein YcdF, DUF218 family [Pseudoalteromonas denitrificans DSM 6059]
MTLFELKKILGSLLMPLPILFSMIIIGLLFIFFKKNKCGLFLCLPAILTLILLSLPVVTQQLISTAENRYSTFNKQKHAKLHYIVVLGCQVKPHKGRPANSQLGACSLARLVEGLRIARLYPYAKLVLSGFSINNTSSSVLLKKTALSLGLHHTRIITNPRAKDTAEEAKQLAYKLIDAKVALVTSAAHMSRAADLFKQQGIDVIAAPTDYYALNLQASWQQFIPNSEALSAATAHQHELIGSWWIIIKRLYDPESI